MHKNLFLTRESRWTSTDEPLNIINCTRWRRSSASVFRDTYYSFVSSVGCGRGRCFEGGLSCKAEIYSAQVV